MMNGVTGGWLIFETVIVIILLSLSVKASNIANKVWKPQIGIIEVKIPIATDTAILMLDSLLLKKRFFKTFFISTILYL